MRDKTEVGIKYCIVGTGVADVMDDEIKMKMMTIFHEKGDEKIVFDMMGLGYAKERGEVALWIETKIHLELWFYYQKDSWLNKG